MDSVNAIFLDAKYLDRTNLFPFHAPTLVIFVVISQGSGTLCEALLMVEAYRGNIVCPNKHVRAV